MFNWGDVLQLIVDGLDQSPFAQEPLLVEPDQTQLHAPFDGGQQLDFPLHQPRHQVFGEVACVPDQLAKAALGQLGGQDGDH